MPNLTRRRTNERRPPLICLGDVRIGAIGGRAGVPTSAPQWDWSCGFYPGIDPGEHRSGIAETFDGARAAFRSAWADLEATLTEADYEVWRRHRDWEAWKNQMHALALPLPTQNAEGIARCFCGEVVTTRALDYLAGCE